MCTWYRGERAAAADGSALTAVEPEHSRLQSAGAAQVYDREQQVQDDGRGRLPQVRAGGRQAVRSHEADDRRSARHRQDLAAGTAQAGGHRFVQEETSRGTWRTFLTTLIKIVVYENIGNVYEIIMLHLTTSCSR